MGLGRANHLRALGPVAPMWKSGRVSYVRADIVEWYARRSTGLEQGFSLARRPVGRGLLTLIVGVLSARADGRIERAGSSLAVVGTAGGTLRYGNLTVTDAHGRHVRGWIALS
ncbi:MAG: hypothetical protein ABSG43_26180, partial [Solirubrobacteraceae bacterium]